MIHESLLWDLISVSSTLLNLFIMDIFAFEYALKIFILWDCLRIHVSRYITFLFTVGLTGSVCYGGVHYETVAPILSRNLVING